MLRSVLPIATVPPPRLAYPSCVKSMISPWNMTDRSCLTSLLTLSVYIRIYQIGSIFMIFWERKSTFDCLEASSSSSTVRSIKLFKADVLWQWRSLRLGSGTMPSACRTAANSWIENRSVTKSLAEFWLTNGPISENKCSDMVDCLSMTIFSLPSRKFCS